MNLPLKMWRDVTCWIGMTCKQKRNVRTGNVPRTKRSTHRVVQSVVSSKTFQLFALKTSFCQNLLTCVSNVVYRANVYRDEH